MGKGLGLIPVEGNGPRIGRAPVAPDELLPGQGLVLRHGSVSGPLQSRTGPHMTLIKTGRRVRFCSRRYVVPGDGIVVGEEDLLSLQAVADRTRDLAGMVAPQTKCTSLTGRHLR